MQVQIPGYKIKAVLGKGGMATVYLAVQEIFEREVALKVMLPSLAEDPSFGQRFLREARIVSQLVHPNIITVFDVGVHDKHYYLSMEHIAGPDLKQACAKLTLLQKLAVIEDVARALDFAGSKGYVHRDIKPENILLRSASGDAVLMDFGIARAAETDLSFTQTGTSLGTPHYMSPEQAKGLGVDHRSDLYSLGVVLYYLLMESVPYPGDSAVAIGVKHITEPVPVLPPYLQLLNPCLGKLMAKQPQQRYQYASELIDDLQQLDHKKLLKQYANKHKYKAPQAAQASSQPTVIHHAETRIEVAPDAVAALSARSSSLAQIWQSHHRLGVKVGAILAVMLLVLLFWPGEEHAVESNDGQVTAEPVPAAPSASEALREQHDESFEPQPRQKNSIADRLSAGFSGLTQRLTQQQGDLSQQVTQLRERMAQGDPNGRLQQQLNGLADQQFSELEELFERDELEQAQSKLRLLAQVFPDFPQRLQSFERRLDSSDLLSIYERKARQRMDQGQYLEPEEDSAEHYYFAMLEIDPKLPAAHNGLVEMAKKATKRAEQDLQAGNWQAAQEVVDRLLALDPNHRASLRLQENITRIQELEPSIEQHLARAEGHLSAGNLYSPGDENAYAYLQKVLSLQRQHRGALQALERVHNALVENVFAMAERGDHQLAEDAIATARRARGNDGHLQQLSTDLQNFVEQKQTQKQLLVEQLVVSAEPLQGVEVQPTEPLKPGDSLYVGLRYSNFSQQGEVLQAVLYGPEGKALANVAVNITSAAGVHYFEIKLARKSYKKGLHQLKLVKDGKTLKQLEFPVR